MIKMGLGDIFKSLNYLKDLLMNEVSVVQVSLRVGESASCFCMQKCCCRHQKSQRSKSRQSSIVKNREKDVSLVLFLCRIDRETKKVNPMKKNVVKSKTHPFLSNFCLPC